MNRPAGSEVELEQIQEWLVAGAHHESNPGGGLFRYVFTTEPSSTHSAERRARNMVEKLRNIDRAGILTLADGPHLSTRTVHRTAWGTPDRERPDVAGVDEVLSEWRVDGDPGQGFPRYTFVWSPERNAHLGDPEAAARTFAAHARSWTSGPHLTMRWVYRTRWTPVES